MFFAIVSIVLCVMCVTAAAHSSEDIRFRDKPSHTVVTNWYNDKSRRVRIYSLEITEPVTLSSPVGDNAYGKCLIIKSENLKITAYTEGKVLCKSRGKDGVFKGERITIIPADEVRKDGTIFLNLTPIKNKTGAVKAPVYLASNNEYLYSVLCSEKAVIAAVSVLFSLGVAMVVLLLLGRKRNSLFYLLPADLSLIVLLLSGSDLFQFFVGSSAAKHSLHAAMYIVLGVIISAGIIQKFLRFSYSR